MTENATKSRPAVSGLQDGSPRTATDLWKRVINEADESACETLFYGQRGFWGRACKYIRCAFRLTEAAEELATTAMTKAFQARKRFDLEKRFEPWFWQIVNNTVRDHLKSAAYEHEVQIAVSHESIHDGTADREQNRRVNSMLLDKLLKCPEISAAELQVLILLREGLDSQEIAESMNVKTERVYQLRSEALRKIRQYAASQSVPNLKPFVLRAGRRYNRAQIWRAI